MNETTKQLKQALLELEKRQNLTNRISKILESEFEITSVRRDRIKRQVINNVILKEITYLSTYHKNINKIRRALKTLGIGETVIDGGLFYTNIKRKETDEVQD